MPDLFTYDTTYANGVVTPSDQMFGSLLQVDHHIAALGGPTRFQAGPGAATQIIRLAPRRASWREREAARANQGVYQAPVWQRETFWARRAPALLDHFAHVAIDDPRMIAFTEDDAKGEADRQTRIKPGRYLKRYFSNVLDDKRIAYLAEWFAGGARPPVNVSGGLELARTSDEIVDVYASDVESCMAYEKCVRVYGAGDLAVAVWRDAEGEVAARCLCWPTRGVYGRVYPDVDECDFACALIQTMEARGWVHERVHDQGFGGARILMIRNASDDYVMPYLDLGYGVDDHGDVWRMARDGEFTSEDTDGVLRVDQPTWNCDRCGDGFHDGDDSHTIFRRVRASAPDDDGEYCTHCRDRHTFYCHGSETDFDDNVPSIQVDGERWARAVAEAAPGLRYDSETESFVTVALAAKAEAA